MGKPLRVLLVERSEECTRLILRELCRGGFEPILEKVSTPIALRAALEKQTSDIILADYTMPDLTALTALNVLKDSGSDLPFIIISEKMGEDIAVGAMKAGADDYLLKENLDRILPAVERGIQAAEERRNRRREDEHIRHQAHYDILTDLPNRAFLYEGLQQAIHVGQNDNSSVAVLVINLDRFKDINNTLGHHRGDLVLQQIGPRLRSTLNEATMIARVGGDEFAILIPGTDREGAILAAQKITEALDRPFVAECISLEICASIGIVVFPDHGEDAATVLRHADVAMYIAKQSGSGYSVYSANQDQYNPLRLAFMSELRHAIEREQLILFYQPKVDLQTNQVSGVEALVRWQHPHLGTIPPDLFISLAEQTGLIKALCFWVLNTALRQCDTWRQLGLEVPVAINLSARNLQDPELPDKIGRLLQTCNLPPESVELEITESIIMADPACAMKILTTLSDMGIRLSIDDFGTGYSSLGYLKKLPVDTIKIDKSFVIDMSVDNGEAIIVRSIIDLGHNLDLTVVAEGVENRSAWDRLTALGCDAAQGYYICSPVYSDDLTRWLKESPWGVPRHHETSDPIGPRKVF